MHITFVKKITADGLPCRKCIEVHERLQGANLLERIDNIVIADERDDASEGMTLAREFKVDRAPFFLVRDEAETVRVYTSYFRFLKEVLNRKVSEIDAVDEMMEQVPDFL